MLYTGMEPVPVFPEFRFFFSSPLSSPAIAVFQAIFSRPKTPAFFFRPKLAGIFFRLEFADILFRSDITGIFFRPELADIFFPARNCRHIFRPEIAGIFSDPKLPAYLPTQDCRLFFDTKLRHLNLHLLFFLQSNEESL